MKFNLPEPIDLFLGIASIVWVLSIASMIASAVIVDPTLTVEQQREKSLQKTLKVSRAINGVMIPAIISGR